MFASQPNTFFSHYRQYSHQIAKKVCKVNEIICIADRSHLVILIMLTEKRNNLALAKPSRSLSLVLGPESLLATKRHTETKKNQIVFFSRNLTNGGFSFHFTVISQWNIISFWQWEVCVVYMWIEKVRAFNEQQLKPEKKERNSKQQTKTIDIVRAVVRLARTATL